MFKKPFVVLDVETTGFYTESDSIIEVACVRYEKGKETGRFESLVRIEKDIPPIVSLITGITAADLADAPVWDEIKSNVQEIVRGAFIIGHNINFDVSFLKAQGIDFGPAVLIDTVPLAQIAFPAALSHSLESLTDELEITHTDKHRAMSDTDATLELFKMIWKKFNSLPRATVDEMKKCLDRSDWAMKPFFDEIRGSVSPQKISPFQRGSPSRNLSEGWGGGQNGAPPRGLSVSEVFGDKGLMPKSWENYESRPQQKQMAEAVAHAFEHGYHLICEAPTGIGKSLAYLIPAAEVALSKKRRVVIATHTITLQNQLYEKDLLHLRRIYQLGARNSDIQVAVLKGRGNYLCTQRLREFKKRSRFNIPEITLLLKILAWPFLNPENDIADMTLTREERMVWDFELSAASKARRGGKCCKNQDCYFQQAIRAAQSAPIVIVNHALLMADLTMGGGLLPEYEYLVVDEAHHFEEVATKAYGKSLTQENLTIPIKSIQAHLSQLKKNHADTLFGQRSCFQDIDSLLAEGDTVLQTTDNTFSVISLFVSTHVPPSDYQESLLISRALMTSEEWLNLGDSVQKMINETQEWLNKAEIFSKKIHANPPLACPPELKECRREKEGAGGDSNRKPGRLCRSDLSERDEFIEEFDQELAIVREQLEQLHPFFLPAEDPHEIRFFTCNESGAVILTSLPLLVGDHLKNDLYGAKKSIILTSATLSTPIHADDSPDESQKPFDYLRKMLNLDDRFEELILDSPFDFEKQALLILPTDLPDVRNHDSLKPVAELIRQIAVAAQGRMLGLFTSYRVIENLYINLAAPLQKEGVNVLAQRFSGGRSKILHAFLNDPAHSILLGTNSFWEGIDIPGDDLICVLMHKLPFDIPSDPLHKARSGMFTNGFYHYTMPRAILRFKQGFGRLIRSQRDYGVMIILDNSLTKKDYGQFFLKSLPNVPVEKRKCGEIAPLIREWLALITRH